MPDRTNDAAQRLKDITDKTSIATSVGLVLFAALIASFPGLWSQLGPYKKALAALVRYEKRQDTAEKQNNALIDTEVGHILLDQAMQEAEKQQESREKRLSPAQSATLLPEGAFLPYRLAGQLKTTDSGKLLNELESTRHDFRDRKIENESATEVILARLPKNGESWTILERAENEAIVNLRGRGAHGLRRFHLERAAAEQTQFKLLGVEFSVGGFWAWDVWLVFCCGGVVYLWLMRRGTFLRARRLWAAGREPRAQLPARTGWPLWVRPLPGAQRSAAFANPVRMDVILDPLGALCLLLMGACVIIALTAAVRLAVISLFVMLGSQRLSFAAAIHGTLCCLATGLMIGILLDWYLPPWQRERTAGLPIRFSDGPSISRRAWLLGAAGIAATALLYIDPGRKWLVRSFLDKPRRAGQTDVRGPRKRRASSREVPLEEGFYSDTKGRIYFVPASKPATDASGRICPALKSRSLALVDLSQLVKWTGPFDEHAVRKVHPSARVAFARACVRKDIPTGMVRDNAKLLAADLQNPEVIAGYRRSFRTVQAMIEVDRSARSRAGRMPNLQLYDLLGALAMGCMSADMLAAARQLLASANIQPPISKSPSAKMDAESNSADRPLRKRPNRRRATGYLCRRAARLEAFKSARLGPATVAGGQAQMGGQPHHGDPPLSGDVASRAVRAGTWDVRRLTIDDATGVRIIRRRNGLCRHRQRKPVRLTSC